MAISGSAAERFVAAPPAEMVCFLLYGPDTGAVTERARALERVAISRGGAEPIRLSSDELSGDPGKIADEAFARGLFGGDPVVALRVLDGRHNVLPALTPVLDRRPEGACVIVEAGDLRPDSALRKAFEKTPHAAAVPCFPAEARDIAALAHRLAEEAGVQIAPDAVGLLGTLLGGDRLATRGEIEKLVLYAGPNGAIAAEDVLLLIGDSAELRTDQIVDAALAGRPEQLETDLERYRAEGLSPAALASAALRHVMLLDQLRAHVQTGASPSAAVERARPSVFFKRKPAVEAALRTWSEEELREARRILAAAVLATRTMPALENATVSDALHRVAALVVVRGLSAR